MLTWYLPSLYGDIRLESLAKEKTKLTIFGLSAQEKVAMTALIREAEKDRVLNGPWLPAMSHLLDLDSTKEQTVELRAKISQVQKVLTKHLKPKREQVSVVKFGDGKMQEMTERVIEQLEEASSTKSPSNTSQAPSPSRALALATASPVAATVAEPYRGCPEPDFAQAEVRAHMVLRAFLTPEQIEDYERTGSFISIGADTGHRYVISSRHSRTQLAKYTRSLYDIEEAMPYCVHDWEVPSGEEVLALHLFLGVPGREMFLRGIRHVDDIH